jgi:hypothetical protein
MWKKEEIKKSLKEDEAYNQPPVSDEFPPRYECDLYGNGLYHIFDNGRAHF